MQPASRGHDRLVGHVGGARMKESCCSGILRPSGQPPIKRDRASSAASTGWSGRFVDRPELKSDRVTRPAGVVWVMHQWSQFASNRWDRVARVAGAIDELSLPQSSGHDGHFVGTRCELPLPLPDGLSERDELDAGCGPCTTGRSPDKIKKGTIDAGVHRQ